MANDSTRLARASVWIAVAGFAAPVALLIVGRQLVAPEHAIPGQRVCLGLFVLSELVALAGGFTARNKPLGKAGVMWSTVLLLIVLGALFVHLHLR